MTAKENNRSAPLKSYCGALVMAASALLVAEYHAEIAQSALLKVMWSLAPYYILALGALGLVWDRADAKRKALDAALPADSLLAGIDRSAEILLDRISLALSSFAVITMAWPLLHLNTGAPLLRPSTEVPATVLTYFTVAILCSVASYFAQRQYWRTVDKRHNARVGAENS